MSRTPDRIEDQTIGEVPRCRCDVIADDAQEPIPGQQPRHERLGNLVAACRFSLAQSAGRWGPTARSDAPSPARARSLRLFAVAVGQVRPTYVSIHNMVSLCWISWLAIVAVSAQISLTRSGGDGLDVHLQRVTTVESRAIRRQGRRT
jgi:hypothetical protein